MNVIQSLLAFFNYKGERIQMEVISARIKNGVAYLRSKDQSKEFRVKSDRISILIDNQDDDSVQVIDRPDDEDASEQKPESDTDKAAKPGEKKNRKKQATARAARDEDFSYLKKSFSTGFYETEKREIVSAYKSAGAKRDEFLLACVRAAAPKKVEHELKKIRQERTAFQESGLTPDE